MIDRQQTFSCSYDKFSKIITFLLIAFTLSTFILSGSELFNFHENQLLVGLLTGVPMVILLIVTFGYSPRGYKIENKDIVMCRYFGDKIIKAESIKSIRIPTEKEMNWPLRKFGNGGLFGYTGHFYTKHIGNMLWYCSRKDRFILIERKKDKPCVISPDDNERFLKAYNS